MNLITFSEKSIDYLNKGSRAVIYALSKTVENKASKIARTLENDAEMTRRASVINKK